MPKSRAEIESIVTEAVRAVKMKPQLIVDPARQLNEYLVDSLELVEVLIEIDERAQTSLNHDELHVEATVNDLIDYVDRAVNKTLS